MNDSAETKPLPALPRRLVASEHAYDGKYHLLLAASGSVATIKIPNIILALAEVPQLSIRIVLTQSSANFLQGQSQEQPDTQTLAKYPNVDGIYMDSDEWSLPWTRGAPILHIELRRWADLLVIAPLSANTLAKIANGICDNLLTSVVRAWQVEAVNPPSSPFWLNPRQKIIMVAPAMNTAMWRHPLTHEQLSLMGPQSILHWFEVLKPVEKELACGDTGDGAMHEWQSIVAAINDTLRTRGIVRNNAS